MVPPAARAQPQEAASPAAHLSCRQGLPGVRRLRQRQEPFLPCVQFRAELPGGGPQGQEAALGAGRRALGEVPPSQQPDERLPVGADRMGAAELGKGRGAAARVRPRPGEGRLVVRRRGARALGAGLRGRKGAADGRVRHPCGRPCPGVFMTPPPSDTTRPATLRSAVLAAQEKGCVAGVTAPEDIRDYLPFGKKAALVRSGEAVRGLDAKTRAERAFLGSPRTGRRLSLSLPRARAERDLRPTSARNSCFPWAARTALSCRTPRAFRFFSTTARGFPSLTATAPRRPAPQSSASTAASAAAPAPRPPAAKDGLLRCPHRRGMFMKPQSCPVNAPCSGVL